MSAGLQPVLTPGGRIGYYRKDVILPCSACAGVFWNLHMEITSGTGIRPIEIKVLDSLLADVSSQNTSA